MVCPTLSSSVSVLFLHALCRGDPSAWSDPVSSLQPSPDVTHSTNCLQTGRDCIYPEPDPDFQAGQESRAESESALIPVEESARLVNVLSHQPFAGFSGDYQLSEMSQWLFHQCRSSQMWSPFSRLTCAAVSNFYVRGQTPVERGQNLCRQGSSHPSEHTIIADLN